MQSPTSLDGGKKKRCRNGYHKNRETGVCRRVQRSAKRKSPRRYRTANQYESAERRKYARRMAGPYSDAYVRRLIPNTGVYRQNTFDLQGPERPNGSFGGGQQSPMHQ